MAKNYTFDTFTRKPTTVTAMQWTGKNIEELFAFIPMNKLRFKNSRIYIKTMNGKVRLHVGDYVVSGGVDDFYPLREEVFFNHYEYIN